MLGRLGTLAVHAGCHRGREPRTPSRNRPAARGSGRVHQDQGMSGLEWTAPAAPFFRRVLSERAVWASGPRLRHDEWDDSLAYYVA